MSPTFSGYGGNIFCSDMGGVTVNGVRYFVSIGIHIAPDDSVSLSASGITFQNLATGVESGEVFSTAKFVNEGGDNDGDQFTITGTFSGAFTGSIALSLNEYYPKPPCGRWCHNPVWLRESSTLTLD